MEQAAKYVGMSDECFRQICNSLLKSSAVQKCSSCAKPLQGTITGRRDVRVNGELVCKCDDCYYEDMGGYLE